MLVLDQKERCGEWAKERITGVKSWGEWYAAIGWERDGELLGVAIFNHWNGPDICVHVAGTPGKLWLTRGALRAMFRYAFIQLGVRRITAHIPSKNLVSVKFNLGLGFQLEGVKRNGWWDDDMLITGLLKEDCQYL